MGVQKHYKVYNRVLQANEPLSYEENENQKENPSSFFIIYILFYKLKIMFDPAKNYLKCKKG